MSIEWYSNWECDDEIICPYCGKKYEPTYEETYIDYIDLRYEPNFCPNCGADMRGGQNG